MLSSEPHVSKNRSVPRGCCHRSPSARIVAGGGRERSRSGGRVAAIRGSGRGRIRSGAAGGGEGDLGGAAVVGLPRGLGRRGRGVVGRGVAPLHVPLRAQELSHRPLRHLLGSGRDRSQRDLGRSRNRRPAGASARDGEAGACPRPAEGALGHLSSGGVLRPNRRSASGQPRSRPLLRLQQLGLQHRRGDPPSGDGRRRVRGVRPLVRPAAGHDRLAGQRRLLPLRARQVALSGLSVPHVGAGRGALRPALCARGALGRPARALRALGAA